MVIGDAFDVIWIGVLFEVRGEREETFSAVLRSSRSSPVPHLARLARTQHRAR